jgi:hypothetical protein
MEHWHSEVMLAKEHGKRPRIDFEGEPCCAQRFSVVQLRCLSVVYLLRCTRVLSLFSCCAASSTRRQATVTVPTSSVCAF